MPDTIIQDTGEGIPHETQLETTENRQEIKEPPASLEAVRSETAESLMSATEFWSTSFGQENNDNTFMELQNSTRRELLIKSSGVIANEDDFKNPKVLKELLQKLQHEVIEDVGAYQGDTPTAELFNQPAADGESQQQELPLPVENQADKDLPALQKQVLEIVHELLFQQAFADVEECNQEIKNRVQEVLLVKNSLTTLPLERIEEAIPAFEGFQIDANIFEQYLAHTEGLMRTSLRSPDLHDVSEKQLKEIIETYAEKTGQEDLGKAIQIGEDRIADPVTYFHTERTAAANQLSGQNAFLETAQALRTKVAELKASPTEEKKEEVKEVSEQLVEQVTADSQAPAPAEQSAPQEVGANYGVSDYHD